MLHAYSKHVFRCSALLVGEMSGTYVNWFIKKMTKVLIKRPYFVLQIAANKSMETVGEMEKETTYWMTSIPGSRLMGIR